MAEQMGVLLVLCLLVVATAFKALPTGKTGLHTLNLAPRASGFANTKDGKAAILERTKTLLDKSQIVIQLPSKGISVEEINALRKAIPAETTVSTVKNTLMLRACEGTDFEEFKANGPLKDQNMFMFIPEGEAKEAYKAYNSWRKALEPLRKDKEFDAKMAVMGNIVYTGKSIDSVTSLPTKKELIQQIAIGIKAVPTKVGRGVNAVPNKLGRAFGLLADKLKEEGV